MRHYNMKPVPIGVVPEHIWKLQRYADIEEAIVRYMNEDIDIPSTWLKELSKLEVELKIR